MERSDDVWISRLAVGFLGSTLVLGVLGVLVAETVGANPPVALVGLLGTLGGLLARDLVAGKARKA